ncbi:hypothetical protein BHE74_00030227 [Ensete ventricosum]|nr:hypothetical protein BHE74_00030227 [Ensete ventricosum]
MVLSISTPTNLSIGGVESGDPPPDSDDKEERAVHNHNLGSWSDDLPTRSRASPFQLRSSLRCPPLVAPRPPGREALPQSNHQRRRHRAIEARSYPPLLRSTPHSSQSPKLQTSRAKDADSERPTPRASIYVGKRQRKVHKVDLKPRNGKGKGKQSRYFLTRSETKSPRYRFARNRRRLDSDVLILHADVLVTCVLSPSSPSGGVTVNTRLRWNWATSISHHFDSAIPKRVSHINGDLS